MAGVYRGMVDDGMVLLDNSGAELWVVQKETLGPYAEPSSLYDDIYRGVLAVPGVDQAANVTYLTMQVRSDAGSAGDGGRHRVGPAGHPGWPPHLVAGRQITLVTRRWPTSPPASRSATASGSAAEYTVVGLTRAWCRRAAIRWSSSRSRMRRKPSSSRTTRRCCRAPPHEREIRRSIVRGPRTVSDNVITSQSRNPYVNAVVARAGVRAGDVAGSIERWQHLTVYTRPEMEGIPVGS